MYVPKVTQASANAPRGSNAQREAFLEATQHALNDWKATCEPVRASDREQEFQETWEAWLQN